MEDLNDNEKAFLTMTFVLGLYLFYLGGMLSLWFIKQIILWIN